FAFHWLLFRVMFGIGRTAFTRDTIREPRYLRGLLISQPVPTPLAWRAVGAPRWLLAIAHTALVAHGIVLPFLVFFPGWPRWMAAAAFAATMIALQAFANLGFFNLIVIVLAVPLLDARSITAQHLSALTSGASAGAAAAATWSVAAGFCFVGLAASAARGRPEWPAWVRARGAGRALLAFLRAVMPLRTVHLYGAWPPGIAPPLKFVPVIEGTRDGDEWHAFEYRFVPSTERS